jgi:hypothetical protein
MRSATSADGSADPTVVDGDLGKRQLGLLATQPLGLGDLLESAVAALSVTAAMPVGAEPRGGFRRPGHAGSLESGSQAVEVTGRAAQRAHDLRRGINADRRLHPRWVAHAVLFRRRRWPEPELAQQV